MLTFMEKQFLEEINKEHGNFQTDYGVIKFIYYLHPLLFKAISNSIKVVDIDKIYEKSKK